MAEHLTERQTDVLAFIRQHIEEEGVPPTVREVASHFSFRSPLSAQLHINALIKKGHLAKADSKSRNLRITGPESYSGRKIPLLGRIRAGQPLLAVQEAEDFITVDQSVVRHREAFALRVTGDSMIEAGILDGDIVVIAPDNEPLDGSIAVVLIDDEVTLKKFFRKGRMVSLVPANRSMQPMTVPAKDIKILGRVTGLVRRFNNCLSVR